MTLSVILFVTLQYVVSIKFWTRLVLHGAVGDRIFAGKLRRKFGIKDILWENLDFHHQDAYQIM